MNIWLHFRTVAFIDLQRKPMKTQKNKSGIFFVDLGDMGFVDVLSGPAKLKKIGPAPQWPPHFINQSLGLRISNRVGPQQQ